MAKPPVFASQRPTVASRARLGLIVETPPPTTVAGKPSRPTRGALVIGTEPGSGSEASGMMPGDLVVAIDGMTVMGVEDLVAQLGELNPGDPVELKFIRNQKLSATTALMAGPDGKLDPEEYAALKVIAASDLQPANAAPTGATPTGVTPSGVPSSALGGLGRTLGGWLAGGTKTPVPTDKNTTPSESKNTEPLIQPSKAPRDGGVVQIDYEEEPAGSLTTDPPSLDQSTPVASGESMELLPPPAMADAANDEHPSNGLAVDDNVRDGTIRKPPMSIERLTIDSLLKELALLRRRIEQLEAEKANPPKS